jgi:hypothetical protein
MEILNKASKEKPRNLWKSVNREQYQVNQFTLSSIINNNTTYILIIYLKGACHGYFC